MSMPCISSFEVSNLYRCYLDDTIPKAGWHNQPLRRYLVKSTTDTNTVEVAYGTIVLCVGYDNGYPVMIGQTLKNESAEFIVTWSDLKFFQKVCSGE
jgi:hypothetical protein